MSWVRLDDSVFEHPKLIVAGAEAAWLWVCGLAYCNRQKKRTGIIPKAKAPILFPVSEPEKQIDRLIEVGLWTSHPDGFHIHDYFEFQPTNDEVEAIRSERSEAGRRGGLKSGARRRAYAKLGTKAEKTAAHQAVAKALAEGVLVRGPCEVCGTTENIQAHHPDYSKQLDVKWLCASDHMRLHHVLIQQQIESNEANEAKSNPDPDPDPVNTLSLEPAVPVTKKSRAKARVVEVASSDYTSFVDEWFKLFQSELGLKPHMTARAGKSVKEILSRVGIEEAKACLKAAFADEFFRRAGAPLWLMASQLDRYRLAAKNTPLDKYSATPKPTTELSQSTIYRPGSRPY